MKQVIKVHAHCIETGEAVKEYHIELNRYGHNITPETTPEIIWDIARKEMKASFNKPVTCWEIESDWVVD